MINKKIVRLKTLFDTETSDDRYFREELKKKDKKIKKNEKILNFLKKISY